jgi:hypothetical protein
VLIGYVLYGEDKRCKVEDEQRNDTGDGGAFVTLFSQYMEIT